MMGNKAQKPVWKVNTGNGVPSDAIGTIADYSGMVWRDILKPESYISKLNNGIKLVQFYQTNRTKAAKYESVECDVCEGDGYVFIPATWSADYFRCKCPSCNGKGYRLEPIKKPFQSF